MLAINKPLLSECAIHRILKRYVEQLPAASESFTGNAQYPLFSPTGVYLRRADVNSHLHPLLNWFVPILSWTHANKNIEPGIYGEISRKFQSITGCPMCLF